MHNIEDIRDIVKSYMSQKRFFHTIGVEKEAVALGEIFLPDKANKLGLAGLLHDITKDFKTEKQLLLCEEYDIAIDKDNIIPKLLHSKTGSEFAKRSLGRTPKRSLFYLSNCFAVVQALVQMFQRLSAVSQ